MKIIDVKVHEIIWEFFNTKIIGKINVISTSNTRKMILIKKNLMEKGIRDELIGSNPHSKGEDFSRSYKGFFISK